MSVNIISRLKAAAAGFKSGGPYFLAGTTIDQYLYGPEDDIIQTQGVDGYLDMVRTDAEVYSSIIHCTDLSIPDVSVVAGGDEPADIRNSELITAILADMSGSTLDPFAHGFENAISTGMTIMEPIPLKVMLPGIGQVIGIESLATRPTRSFTEGVKGIETDEYGRILKFRQSAFFGGAEVEPGQVIYYPYRGNSENPYGQSILRPVYESWKSKIKVRRVAQVFMVTNASGIRHAKMPAADYSDPNKRAQAQSLLEKLGSLPSFTTNSEWDLQIQLPTSGVGGHFREMIEMLNEEIRRGILGDSSFSAQAGSQGSQASRQVSQDNVRTRFQIQGRSYCDSVGEQLFPMLLRWNGYTTGKIPKLQPTAIVSGAEARDNALRTLAELRQAGVLKRDLPEPVELNIMQNILEPLDITIDELSPVAKQTPPAPVQAAEPRQIRAADSKALKKSRADAKQLIADIDAAAKDLGETWESLVPQILAQLNKKLFEQKPGGGWKVTDLTSLRQIVIDTVRYKSSEIRKSINAGLGKAREAGLESAQANLPVRAASAYGWTPNQAKMALQNRVYLLMEKKYPSIAGDMYYLVENSLVGNTSIVETQNKMRLLLESSDFNPAHAQTIMDTAMSTAWNGARDELFAPLENASGTGPTDIVGYRYTAVIDDYTTDQCIELNDEYFKVDDPSLPRPPLHYNCRSLLIPIFGDEAGSVEWMDPEKSKEQISRMQANKQIQQGFGGV